MTCVTLVKAALARFLFAIHALMTIWRVVQQEGDDYWKLAVGILCLLGEGTLQHNDRFYYIRHIYRISSYSFRVNYSFLNLEIQRSQYIRPKVTVHKGVETIQGRKLYEAIRYLRSCNGSVRPSNMTGPATKSIQGRPRVYMYMRWFIWVDNIWLLLTKGNRFKGGGDWRPNLGEARCWLATSHMGFGVVVLMS